MTDIDTELATYTPEALISAIRNKAPTVPAPPAHSLQAGRPGMIYFMACRDRLKVGYSANPGTRLKQLQGHCPYQLVLIGVLLGTGADEASIKRALRYVWAHGEWFCMNDTLEKIICFQTFVYAGIKTHRTLHAIMQPDPTIGPSSANVIPMKRRLSD